MLNKKELTCFFISLCFCQSANWNCAISNFCIAYTRRFTTSFKQILWINTASKGFEKDLLEN